MDRQASFSPAVWHDNQTPISLLWPPAQDWLSQIIRFFALLFVGSLALTLAAKMRTDIWPVPVTMQSFALMMIAVIYGGKMATGVVLAYLVQGGAGLPVFAGTPEKGIGIAYMVGPTGGYLAGFILTVIVTAYLVEKWRDRGFFGLSAAFALGLAPTYVLGLFWLYQFVPFGQLLAFGVMPFLLGEVFKILIAASLVCSVRIVIANSVNRKQDIDD